MGGKSEEKKTFKDAINVLFNANIAVLLTLTTTIARELKFDNYRYTIFNEIGSATSTYTKFLVLAVWEEQHQHFEDDLIGVFSLHWISEDRTLFHVPPAHAWAFKAEQDGLRKRVSIRLNSSPGWFSSDDFNYLLNEKPFEEFLNQLFSEFEWLGFVSLEEKELPNGATESVILTTEDEKEALIAEMEKFHDDFVKYKELVLKKIRGPLTPEGEKALRNLSSALQRKYGELKTVIEAYGGSTDVLLEGGKIKFEAFTSAFSPSGFDPVALEGIMDTAIAAINIAIGKLHSLEPPTISKIKAPKESVFESGKPYDAYRAIMDIIKAATNTLIIVDPYVDSTLFIRFEKVQPAVQIKILTQHMISDFQLVAVTFKEQREKAQQGALEIRRSNKFHDRFIVADYKVFNIGASIKDAGNKMFAINEIEGADIRDKIREIITRYWDEAEVVL